MLDCSFQLGILAIKSLVREVIDNDVWIYAPALDQPFAFRAVNTGLGR